MTEQVCGYFLDKQQQEIVLDDSERLLVVAGAGSGKTLTIVGKIKYLIKYMYVRPEDILCLSFTRASSQSLKDKIKKELNVDVSVYTFHKLSLEILKEKQTFLITGQDTLNNIIHNFFYIDILNYSMHMRNVLYYFNIKTKKNIKEQYLNFCYSNIQQIELLEKLICTFINLFKCNNYQITDFNVFLKKSKNTIFYKKYKKEKIFLMLVINVYLIYKDYLLNNNEIDFDDMINYATEYVHKYGVRHNYKYIIIDEYQDTSYIRFLLIKEILNKTGAKLMVVGDDFQSIYKFSGCDISLFLDFNNYFSSTSIRKIENTYRNSQELVNIAGDFVMKNPKQIKKRLKSNKHISKPIEVVYYKNIKQSFLLLIEKIYKETKKPIMILGRNNTDINMVLNEKLELKDSGKLIYKDNNKIDMYYLTSHKSKGLEEENVILINLENRLLGFPNQTVDEKALRFVSCSSDNYPYSEERRLFYVALTRTKNKVYLLTPIKNPSIFVRELVRNYKDKIKISTSF